MSWFREFTFCFSLEISLAWITLNAFHKKVQIIQPIGAQGKEFQFRTKSRAAVGWIKKKWRRRRKVWQSRVKSKVYIRIYWKVMLKMNRDLHRRFSHRSVFLLNFPKDSVRAQRAGASLWLSGAYLMSGEHNIWKSTTYQSKPDFNLLQNANANTTTG